MNFKKITKTIIFSSLISSFAVAQDWTQNIGQGDVNFHNVQENFYNQHNQGRSTNDPAKYRTTPEGKGIKQFKRWEYFWQSRLDENGNLASSALMFDEWKEYEQNRIQNNSASWSFLGPKNIPDATSREYAGMGRVNCLTIAPDNDNILWVGTPAGGLWKSTDGGQSWTTTTDNLPSLGISAILIDPTNTDIMYLGTGDVDGSDTYGVGVLKSTDGGNTWNSTGLSTKVNDNLIITGMVMNPQNTQIMIASYNGGIMKTTDGWATRTVVKNTGSFKDIKIDPNNSSVILAATNDNKIFRSSNNGDNWTEITAGLPTEGARVKLAFAPSKANKIYAIIADKNNSSTQGIYMSTDGGVNWSAKNTSKDLLEGQGFYDISIVVNPSNDNEVYAGGVNLYKSSDGGTNWTQITTGIPQNITYVHSDHHNLYFHPSNDKLLFSVNDGGIHKVDIGDLTKWTDLSEGLHITQFYRLGGTPKDAGEILAGAQDNDVAHLSGGTWYNRNNNSDGMECAFDYTDANIAYPCSQSGAIYRTTNGFQSRSYIKPANAAYGGWTIPFVLDPIDPNTMYAGYSNLVRTESVRTVTSSSNWTDLTTANGQDYDLINIAIAPSDNKTIYYTGKHYQGQGGTLQRSTDKGATWTEITTGLPTETSAYVNYIAVSSTNPQELWVTCAGVIDGKKVYHSTDGGANWTNISANLPNIGMRCVVYETGTNGSMYIGTDFGVFYKDSKKTDWEAYGTDLPNVIVNEIEIHYGVKKLRVATYGRGVWEAPLASTITSINPNTELTNNTKVYPTIANNQIMVEVSDVQDAKIILSNLVGGVHTIMENVNTGTYSLDVNGLASGTYFVTIQTAESTFTQKVIVE